MLGNLPLETVLEWAGYLGVAFYLGSYVALQLGMIPGVGYTYAALNLVASSLVLVSLIYAFNMASAMIQISWIVISVVGMTRTFLISRRLYFTGEEELFLKGGLPGVPREIARKILDAGNWLTLDPDVFMTNEGQPVDRLYFISSGHAGVYVMGNKVAEVAEGFIGELNVMEGGPASASVKTLHKTRVFCISGENLRRLTRADTQTSLYIETHLSTSTKQKLMQANLQLSASKGVE